jgi:hypothetical protein
MNSKENKKRPPQEIFHSAIGWRLGQEGLAALKDALERDDPALLQSTTVSPDINVCCRHDACTGACAIGLALWKGWGLCSVGEVEHQFSKLAVQVDSQLGSGSCMRWVSWYDEMPRQEMRRVLLPQVLRALEHECQPADPRGRPVREVQP